MLGTIPGHSHLLLQGAVGDRQWGVLTGPVRCMVVALTAPPPTAGPEPLWLASEMEARAWRRE